MFSSIGLGLIFISQEMYDRINVSLQDITGYLAITIKDCKSFHFYSFVMQLTRISITLLIIVFLISKVTMLT